MKLRHDRGEQVERLLVIIEHLEPVLGKWIWLEYEHVSKMVGRENLLFTNIRNKKEAFKLVELGKVSLKSVVHSKELARHTSIILDPQSPMPLLPKDFTGDTCLIVGGILGDHPPRGRTRLALTRKLSHLLSRNLGPYQFSVDGAVYVALSVASGNLLTDIPIELGAEIKISKKHVTFLPFAYPLVRGKPLMASGLRRYLRQEIFEDEGVLFRTGSARSIL
nr:SAM-dependent methyltransferase [Candidatus Njordarchaeota archaeon]